MPALSLVVLYVSDLDASVAFYAGLGLDLIREQHGAGPVHYSAGLDGSAVLELYSAGDRPPTRTRLGLRGVSGNGGTVTDPDGNVVERLPAGPGAASVWVLIWSAAGGVTIPATSAHRTRRGARSRIRSELRRRGLDPAAAVEETREGVVMGDLGEVLGDVVYTIVEVTIEP